MISEAKPFGPRVPVRRVSRVPSGSPGTVALRAAPRDGDAPGIALVLTERGLGLRVARAAATHLFDHGFVVVALPRFDSLDGLRRALSRTGAEVAGYGPPDTIDALAIGGRSDLIR